MSVVENFQCFLLPNGDVKEKYKGKEIYVKHKEEMVIGRGTELGIMDLACSKKQLILEADVLTKTLKILRIGKNPSLLAGLPMDQNEVYLARDGMTLQLTPSLEFTVSFQEHNHNDNTESRTKKNFKWSTSGSLLFCLANNVVYGSLCKIAAFDMDGTLIKTKSGYIFPTNNDDWKLWHSDVKRRLKLLISEGYNLVMFTNQAHLDIATQTKRESFKKKIENIINVLDVPFTVFIAMAQDKYRKPCTGMWQYLTLKISGEIDMDSSFYVGDAAGRIASNKPKISSDFDITDRLFARNINIKFYTPEEFFLNEPPRPFKDVDFHPADITHNDYPDMALPSKEPEIILMVGSPASGKSHFVHKILEPKGYVVICRDNLITWTKCRNNLIIAIDQKQSVAYDATNPSKEARKIILDVCRDRQFKNIRCFLMTTPEDRCIHNNRFRFLVKNSKSVPHPVLVNYKKNFEEPTIDEGFVSIVKIPFVPDFQSLEFKELYTKYLLGRIDRSRKMK